MGIATIGAVIVLVILSTDIPKSRKRPLTWRSFCVQTEPYCAQAPRPQDQTTRQMDK
jgi:hypothetical protein